MSIISGAFDSSSLVFYLMNVIHGASRNTVQLFHLFVGFTFFPIVLLVLQLLVMPSKTFVHGKDSEEEKKRLLAPETSENGSMVTDLTDEDTEETTAYDGIRDLCGKPISFQLRSFEFILLTFFMCVMMVKMNFYIGSVETQIQSLLPKHTDLVVNFFNLALPIGGVVAIPPIGWLLDNRPIYVSLFLIVALAMGSGVLGLFANLYLQLVGITIFVVLRPLIYTAASDFCAKM